MAKSLARITALLQIREGEGRTVGWLFAHAFFGGMPLTLSSAAGNALFLEHHGAPMLPWVYLAAALVVPFVGWVCLRIESAVSFDKFLISVVSIILAGQLAARASIYFLGLDRGTWVLPLWSELEYSLTGLELWALAGRLLNVQQAKRLLGVIGSGAPLAGGMAGLLSPIFVRFLGTPNLFLVSACASLASLFVLRRICVREGARLTLQTADDAKEVEAKKLAARKKKAPPPQPKIEFIGAKGPARKAPAKKKKKETGATAELRPYTRTIYLLMALSFVSYYFIERLFYDRAEARLPDSSELASFLGVFMGVCGLIMLVFRVWASAQILARWGLLVGLLTLPLFMALGSSTATVFGIIGGAGTAAVFWAIAITRASDRVLHDSLDMQSAFMLYQPLPKSTRVAVQGTGEAIIGPLAGGFAGGSLIVLDKLGFDVIRLTALAAGIATLWVLTANHLRRAYRVVLERALADRRIRRDELVLGESARRPLLRALESNYAGEVLYALDMLEAIGWRTARALSRRGDAVPELRPATILKKLLDHSSTDVRREALRRIEQGAITELLPEVTALAEKESDERIRARAFRVLAAIADDDDAERLWLEGNASPDPRIRREVMTGCLASGCIDRIALAWHELRRLAESEEPEQRILAAEVLRKVASSTFHRPLLKLLNDKNRNVQRAAIVACKTVHHPRLLPIVVAALRSRRLRAPAASTLAAMGEVTLPVLRDLVHDVRDWRVRVRALRVAARVKGPLAERLALDLLESTDEEVRHGALLTLTACGHQPHHVPVNDGDGPYSAGSGAHRVVHVHDVSSLAPSPSSPSGLNDRGIDDSVSFSNAPSTGGVGAFERLLKIEVSDATWTLAALIDLEVVSKRLSLTGGPLSALPPSAVPSSLLSSSVIDQDGMQLVARALRRELLGSRDRILLLLSFLYDAKAMHTARASYSSASTDRRAIVLELLDNALPVAIRSLVIPLFDDVSAKQALEDMPDEAVEDEIQQGRRGRLKDLVNPERLNVTAWTRTCAIWALRDADSIRPLEKAADEDVRETARFVVKTSSSRSTTTSKTSSSPNKPSLNPGLSLSPQMSLSPSSTEPVDSRGPNPMLTIEKVLILRSVPMFERTPDHILAELAAILKEVDLEPDVDLIKEGDFGDCMFVIVHGAVKVHRGGDMLAELGARDIVGEMSVLDPEPRSASVTTTKQTRFLRIDRDDFFDLMADRIEIAQGILGVLCQRLRGLGSRSLSMLPPSPGSDF